MRKVGSRLFNGAKTRHQEDRLSNQFVPRSLPITWPVLSDLQPLLTLENLPSNMRLWGDNIGPDFWRYKVEPRLRAFNLESKGITHENYSQLDHE